MAGAFGRSPPSLPRDQLVGVLVEGSDQHRLEDAQLSDGRGQGGQGLLIERRPRLMAVGPDGGHGDLEQGRAAVSDDLVRNQGPEPFT
jgi:hypothetical protein